ncbi:efflux transporter outer membrane subunit [Flavobacterium agricola]|uniref:Efflux transporter outer membrane subunit n=1 Tax=Flavobacterium agricola TaxID=2870839 RepID=A0ABY6LZK1_9FLAO|nr:efflux transporter outer membrane subunit [Flavobacterium agricola]UYW01744.1 efflux transporter outer membrane subunit [Flavobacterium agricola]
MKKNVLYIGLFVATFAFQACVPQKNYKIKTFDMPQSYRGMDTLTAQNDSLEAIKVSWKDFFKDEKLTGLIEQGLVYNFDVQKSLKNIEIANQRYAQAKQEWLPSINANLANSNYQFRSKNFYSNPSGNYYDQKGKDAPDTYYLYTAQNASNISLSWEIDIWGKIKSQKAASLAAYLQTNEAQKLIQTTVVSKIAEGYFNLLLLNAQLKVARSNYDLNKNTLRFVELQYESGKTTALGIQQTRSQMLVAKALIPRLERQIMIQENDLQLLVGNLPDDVDVNAIAIDDLLENDLLSNNIPLQMVSLRPDVKAANLELRIKNAEVGVTQANRYPNIEISLVGGVNSLFTKNWFDIPGSLMGGIVGGITQPIFNKRKLKTAYKVALLEREQAEIDFQKTVYTAVNEISDAIITINKLNEELEIAKEQLETAQLGTKQATMLFNSGYATYLEVVNSQRVALNTELDYNELKLNKLNARIKLYKALGGGWDQ